MPKDSSYLSTPLETSAMPKGVPYIIGNEAAERFSFYGMKAILVVYMTTHLKNAAGENDFYTEDKAKWVFHLFVSLAYLFPLIGALLCDLFLGKYRTILILSMGYCVGHGFLALGDTGLGAGILPPETWMLLGLGFIAIGAGGIKPCVSTHVGDQFGTKNKHLLAKVYNWFYFSINAGSFISTLLIPWVLKVYGPALAFGIPGVLMGIATFVFWLGRKEFVHVPASGFKKFSTETFSPDGRRSLLNLAPLFLVFIPMFWAIFDQTGSAWVLQANNMDRHLFGKDWESSQIQALNPLFIMILIPVFVYGFYPLAGKFFRVTPLRKIGMGLFVAAVAFAITGVVELRIEGGAKPNIAWHFVAYLVLTGAEVLVSITSLEFAYTQAPRKIKSFVMSISLLSVFVGNFFTAGVNFVIANEDGSSKLAGADYYWFFTASMVLMALAFSAFARFYKGKSFVQGEGDNAGAVADSEM